MDKRTYRRSWGSVKTRWDQQDIGVSTKDGKVVISVHDKVVELNPDDAADLLRIVTYATMDALEQHYNIMLDRAENAVKKIEAQDD